MTAEMKVPVGAYVAYAAWRNRLPNAESDPVRARAYALMPKNATQEEAEIAWDIAVTAWYGRHRKASAA